MRLLGLAFILLAATLLRVPAFFQPPWYLDEGIFAAVADVWLSGGALYVDAWDNKPPGIFAVYAAGWTTGLDMVAVRFLDLGAMLAVIALVYWLARRAGGEVSGLIAAAVAGLLLGLPTIEGYIANTESFLILCSTAGIALVLLALDREEQPHWLLVAGLAFGAACLFKQVAVFDALAVAVFLALVYRTRLLRPVMTFGLGVVAVPLAVALAFVVAGNFDDLWFATVTFLVDYRGDSQDTGSNHYIVALLPFALALPFALWIRPWRSRAPEALFVLWLAFTAIAVSASGRGYPHYFIQMAPPFALVIGMVASSIAPRLPRAAVATGLVAMTLLLADEVSGPLPDIAWHEEPHFTRAYYENFLDYAFGDADRQTYDDFFARRAFAHLGLYDEVEVAGLAGERVFVWGDVPWLYVEEDFDNPLRYMTLLNATEVERTPEAVATLVLQAEPDYILVMEENLNTWESALPLLSTRYQLQGEFLRAVLYARS